MQRIGTPFRFSSMSRVSGKLYFVYVLWSASGRRFYIGISEDPETRLQQHNDGRSRWTSRYCPWKLVWKEKHEDYHSARRRELQLKKQKGGQGFFVETGLRPADFRPITPSGS